MIANESIYVYGLGREFLYLYNNTDLFRCRIAGLIDDTPHKQKYFTLSGKSIFGSEVLSNSSASVLITAVAHAEKLKARLDRIGFLGKVYEL